MIALINGTDLSGHKKEGWRDGREGRPRQCCGGESVMEKEDTKKMGRRPANRDTYRDADGNIYHSPIDSALEE